MIYEERYTTLKMHGLDDYLKLYRENKLPLIQSFGGQVICFSNGLIGDPNNAIFQITGFPDIDSWQNAQRGLTTGREELVESEEVRLLKRVTSRPKEPMPPEDRRNYYTYRRLFINPDDLEEFVNYSENYWPAHEAMDARMLGVWTPIAVTNPLEIVLMSGYNGPAHWEQTRSPGGSMYQDLDPELRNRGINMTKRRNLSVRGSWVRLTRQLEL